MHNNTFSLIIFFRKNDSLLQKLKIKNPLHIIPINAQYSIK